MLKKQKKRKNWGSHNTGHGTADLKRTNQHTYDKSIAVTEVFLCKNRLLQATHLPFVSLARCALSDSSPRGARAVISVDLLRAGANMLDSQLSLLVDIST